MLMPLCTRLLSVGVGGVLPPASLTLRLKRGVRVRLYWLYYPVAYRATYWLIMVGAPLVIALVPLVGFQAERHAIVVEVSPALGHF